jgi:hypothetical protein
MKLFLSVQYFHSQIIFLQKIAISEDFSTPPNGTWNGILSYELGNIIIGASGYRKEEDEASGAWIASWALKKTLSKDLGCWVLVKYTLSSVSHTLFIDPLSLYSADFHII